jgi:imidazolonepropionase-like amidohydrolase
MKAYLKIKRVLSGIASLAILCALLGAMAVLALAQNGEYAIKDAKIVTVTGAVIARGTVHIKDGKIVAVGEKVTVPSSAKVVDGRGLSVYPGMIDSGTTLGLTEVG